MYFNWEIPGRSWWPNSGTHRLTADACELCGSTEKAEVHHIRALKDLNPQGRKQQPDWGTRMAPRRRKTLVVCRICHEDIHAGRPTRKPR